MAYIYDLTDTWNASGTTFNGIKLNVTNTASAAASKLVTLQIGGTEHFSVTKAGVGYFSGNLGIGNTSPNALLELSKASGAADLRLSVNGTLYANIYASASDTNIFGVQNLPLIFGTNNTERMRITGGGNVGIGTSSPARTLSVYSASSIPAQIESSGTDARISIFTSSGSGGQGFVQASSGALLLGSSNTERMRIDSSGNVGIGTSSPTVKLQVISDGPPAASGNMTTGMMVASAIGSFALNMGANSTGGYTWLNSAYTNNSGIASPMVFMTGAAERMRINSSGLVGIGTSSPQVGVHVSFADQSTNRIRLQNTGSGGGNFDIVGGLAGASNAGLSFFDVTNSATRMYIDSSGRVLIGTTATVGGTWSNEVKQTSSGVWPWGLNCVDRGLIVRNSSTSTGYYAYFEYNGGTNNGSISWSGGTTAYNTTSDARIKDNIVDAPDAGDLIDAIQVRSWDFKADGAHWRYGMVAQELLEVAPEAVNKPEDEEMMMGVDYSKLVPMLIKEVQSLRARVAQLEGN